MNILATFSEVLSETRPSMAAMPRRNAPTEVLRVGDVVAEVTYKSIKNLRLRVLPPDGRVAVSVPHGVPEETVSRFVRGHLDWIARAKAHVTTSTPSTAPLADGVEVNLWGRSYEARVSTAARASAELTGAEALWLRGPDADGLRRGLEALYKEQIHAALETLRPEWEEKVGRRASAIRLRRMTTRWGTCNTKTAAITLNVALAEHPPSALEYVLVHELVHLHERGHGPAFTGRMDRLLPDWRIRRRALRGQG